VDAFIRFDMQNFWKAPQAWGVASANHRAFEVLKDPNLSGDNLPPEAALLFPPGPPDFPQLFNLRTGSLVTIKRNKSTYTLRDIPWLPQPFDMDTPGWKVNLFMIFGATARDMTDRVDPHEVNPKHDRQFLSNRLVKRSSDYRATSGGFCVDYKAFKGGKLTLIAETIIQCKNEKRCPLTQEQLFFVSLRLSNMRTNHFSGCDLGGQSRFWHDAPELQV
jgi:hypothetical protein